MPEKIHPQQEEYVTIYEKYWASNGVRYKQISLDEGETWERAEMMGLVHEGDQT